jgi:IS30 family transposase
VSLRQSGLGVNAIADQLGVHRTYVYRVLRRNDPAGDRAKCKAWLDREAKKGSRIVSVKADAVVRPDRA